jgi:hypothetical protein
MSIECPQCHRTLAGLDVYHGRMMRSDNDADRYARRSIAVCQACGLGLETAEFFARTRMMVRETRNSDEIDDLKRELGLVPPLACHLRADDDHGGV